MVQRDFGRIIAPVGTPARAPKPRGDAPGRAKGVRPPKRTPQPVIKKAKKTAKAASPTENWRSQAVFKVHPVARWKPS